MKINVIWIDSNLDDEENIGYIEQLKLIGSFKLNSFKEVNEAIKYMKFIEFEETRIILRDSLYSEFINRFQENIIDICISPKIIIFTKNKNQFIKNNKDYNNDNIFYSSGGIATSFNEIKEFLKNENKINKINKPDDIQLTFERIDNIDKLILPMFFKTLIDNQSINKIEEFTNELYQKYGKNEKLKELLGPINSVSNIPVEILSKYYARLYTADSDFYKEINKELTTDNKNKFLPYIKILYEGVKLKSLPLASDKILYRGSKISNKEIDEIKKFIREKKEGLPSSIAFSKGFLSFSKERSRAEKFIEKYNNEENDKNSDLSNVLYILEKDDNIGYSLTTHGDIEKISFYPNEREVLFFPFSSFEIKELTYIESKKRYEIKLKYLGKYLKEIENNENLTLKENKIPDSKFKNSLGQLNLIEEAKMKKLNTKALYEKYQQYKIDINEIDSNIIIGEININKEDVNKAVRIINSSEGKENEIKEENIDIKINEESIAFSHFYKFEKEGQYKIDYIFKNNLTNLSNMFSGCYNLVYLNLSYFNSRNVIDMNNMFNSCHSLLVLDLSNLNTSKVTNMTKMFIDCHSLKKINLSSFDTRNVTKMSYMFSGCYSLTDLDLFNFNTTKVTDMSYMFHCCYSLNNINISKFITENVINMQAMFHSCNSLTYLNLDKFDTQNVTDMHAMFHGCKSLKNLNIENFDIENVINISCLFFGCESLEKKNVTFKDPIIIKCLANEKIII